MIYSIDIIKTSKEINQTTYRQDTKLSHRENNCIDILGISHKFFAFQFIMDQSKQRFEQNYN